MKKLFGKIKFNRNYFFFSLFILAVVAIVLPQTANAVNVLATVGNASKLVISSPILIALGTIAALAVGLFGALDMMIISFIVNIVQYNNFINEPSIRDAWIMVRDLCNMFFILILLVIAFATILRLPSYEWKKLLPKLLIMAVLINFSRTICGLIIDFSQVIMVTFTNAFGAGGQFVDMTQMRDYFAGVTFSGITTSDWSVLNVVIGLLIGIMFLIISGIVLVVAMSVFLMRIVMLWIYIVLSPLAFLAAAFPAGQKYASQWWSEFMKYILNGPVLAFFIWMALMTSQQKVNFFAKGDAATALASQCFGTSKIMCMGNFMPFILSIGMLVGGLIITQQIGGVGSGIASKGLDFAKKAGTKILNGDNFVARKVAKTMGVDWRPIKLAESFKASMETNKKKDETAIREKGAAHFQSKGSLFSGARSLAFGMGAGEAYFNRYADGFLGHKGVIRAAKDVFVNPSMRKDLGGKMDAEEGKIKKKNKERDVALAKIEETMEFRVKEDIDRDLDLNIIQEKADKNNKRIDELNNIPEKDLSLKEKNELERLNKNNEKLKGESAEREKIVREKSKKDFLETDAGKGVREIENDIKASEKSLNELRGQIMKVQAPVAFEARSAYRKDVEEAKTKYKSITNADELMKAFADADQRGDKFDQVAILEKLSGDANLNEELRGKGYGSDARGLASYVNNLQNDFGEQKGLSNKFSKEDRIQILNDLGESEERVGHWETAKMVGMNSKGDMESLVKFKTGDKGKIIDYDDSGHAKAAFAEVMKMDLQKIVGSLNRLAMGGEDGKGEFQISNLGKMIYKALASGGVWEGQKGRIQINLASNLAGGNVVPILQRIMKADEKNSAASIGAIRGRSGGGTANPDQTKGSVKDAGEWSGSDDL